MEPIDLVAPDNEVPIIVFRVLDKTIKLPITGRRLIMFKAGMMAAMGFKRLSDLANVDPATLEPDELKSIAIVDDILHDCADTADLAGTLSLPACNAIIGQLMEILFAKTHQGGDEVKKK